MGLLWAPRQIITETNTFKNAKIFLKRSFWLDNEDQTQCKPLQLISFFPHVLPFEIVKADALETRGSFSLASETQLRPLEPPQQNSLL